jgi:sterol desaturase/sphingolipid hydroxylase (fatty acid hydroxylase superfamily)
METETALRLGSFLAIFAVMASWEALRPRRPLSQPKYTRWLTNLGIVVADALLLRLMGALVAYSAALYAQQHGWGVFNHTGWPLWLEFALALLILDFAIYLQHFASHHVSLLWRLHQVHHTDLDVDLTTGVRFHPVEIGLSMLYKVALVLLLGASPWAVLIFEIVLNGAALFNHSNAYLPAKLDRYLRIILVTPDMHRVHHSTIVRETNSNFGFSVPWWDKLCGTYRASPAAGQQGLEIGLKQYRDFAGLGFFNILLMPFRRLRTDTYPKQDTKKT